MSIRHPALREIYGKLANHHTVIFLDESYREPIQQSEEEGYYIEAYSAAGEIGFGCWLVEHYLSYHVNCPDGCGLGESTRGRKDSPYFQMSYGSFDNIPDLVDPFVESFLPLQQGFTRSFLERCVAP